jgi:hypothetical protein
MADILDEAIHPIGFAETVLGLSLYPWQDKAVAPLNFATGSKARRINIAVIAPNGAGKDDRIIPTAVFWWLANHKRGKVVITTKSDLQLTNQTIPALEKHRTKLAYPPPVTSPRFELNTPSGGKCIAFVTNLAARAEGWHKEDDIDGPLLLIVNEAATVDDEIFTALDRCTPNALMLISKPGLKFGRLWDVTTAFKKDWIVVRAGLKDCPHIPKERIDYIVNTYGEDHPVTRSTLHGEFMEQDEVEKYVINDVALRGLIDLAPPFKPGYECMFCDFGDGGAENTIAKRNGNKIELVDCWREKNKFASVARFIQSFRKHNMMADKITGDAADKEMCDLLRDAGWSIKRQNFGSPANDKNIYLSWGAEAWREAAIGIEKREWILPNDPTLIAQLTSRQRSFGAQGKLGVEEKTAMQKRLKKPDYSLDRADAVIGCMAQRNYNYDQDKLPDLDRWQEELERSGADNVLSSIGARAGY